VDCEVYGHGQIVSTAQWGGFPWSTEKTRLMLTYSTSNVRWFCNYYIREEFEPSLRPVSCMNPASLGLEWASTGDAIKAGETYIQGHAPNGVYKLTKYKLFTSSPAASIAGCTNAGSMLSPTLGLSFAAQTLLYVGAYTSRANGIGLNDWINQTHVFWYNSLGWNSTANFGTGSMDYVLLPNGQRLAIQAPVDMSTIFLFT
jgi:hypothetical protein